MTAPLVAHIERDPWPHTAVLCFMGARADDQAQLTINCGADVGAASLCTGRIVLGLGQDEAGEFLWPSTPCSSGHPLAQVEVAFAHQADAIGRGRPAVDWFSEFLEALGRHAIVRKIDPVALRAAVDGALRDAG